jgi:hypothetical protein
VICGSELTLWLNKAETFGRMINRIDDFCDLCEAGHLVIATDRDIVVAISASATAPIPATLPPTTA